MGNSLNNNGKFITSIDFKVQYNEKSIISIDFKVQFCAYNLESIH